MLRNYCNHGQERVTLNTQGPDMNKMNVLQTFSNPFCTKNFDWNSVYDLKYFQGLPFGLFQFENLQPDYGLSGHIFQSYGNICSFNSHVGYKILKSHSPEEFFIALAIGLVCKLNTGNFIQFCFLGSNCTKSALVQRWWLYAKQTKLLPEAIIIKLSVADL